MWLTLLTLAQASPVEFYGFGGRRMGRAGGGVAIADGPESILSNPASLAGMPYPELSIGLIYGDSALKPFPGVWWDTNQDGQLNDSDSPLEMGPNYDSTMGILVGIGVPFGKYIAGGLGLYLPPQRLFRLQTFEPALPSYFLYENRTQRYELGMALGVRPIWGLAAGVGLQMIPKARYSLDATINATISGATDGDTAGDLIALDMDVHSMSLDITPGFAPIASLHWDAGQAIPALDGLMVGAAWRGTSGLPVDVDVNAQVNIRSAEIGELKQLLLPLVLGLQLGVFDHYVPEQWNFGVAYTFEDTLTISGDIRRTGWDKMEINIAKVVASNVEGAMVDLGEDPIQDQNPSAILLKATWSQRLGLDLNLPPIHTDSGFGDIRLRVRGGVGYDPSPLVSQSRDTALLDSDRLIFALGLGVEHRNPLWRPGGKDRKVQWDGFFQYHLLANGSYDRGDPGVPTAGYPIDGTSIPVGGHLFAGGAQWSFQY